MANVIGQRVRRLEDRRFLTGRGHFVDGLHQPGEATVTFVRSEIAHARITGIDADAARALPGVRVFTAAEVDLATLPLPPFLGVDERMQRPPLAGDVVRFIGEIVAAVVTDDAAAGADAAELVVVDYDPLPVVTDPRAAARDEVVLFGEVGTNVCVRMAPEGGPDGALFEKCEAVVSGTMVSQRMAPSPLEPRSTVAAVGEDGRLTAWLSTQTPHQDRDGLAGMLGLEPSDVRVVAPDVGGGFGAKGLSTEDVLVAWLARELGRPVRWTETRSENMVAMYHGRGQILDFTIGGSRDGEVLAYRLAILQDAGAYPGIGSFLPHLTAMMASGVYRIPAIELDVTAVATNTTPIGAFRGAGRPEATQAIERAIDMFAAEIGMDPAQVRRRNFIAPDAFPFTTASGATYDTGDYERALDLLLAGAGYDALRDEQRRRREAGAARQLGIGLSAYVEVTNGIAEPEFGAVEITPAGEAILRTGSFSHGQGHETTFATIVAERLGMPLESVRVLKGDTDEVARGGGTYGSKSTQIGGVAAGQAATEVAERAKRLAADLLEAAPEDIVLDGDAGRFHVAGAPRPALGWPELAGHLADDGRLAELHVEQDYKADAGSFPFGAHLAVVEVDTETGAVEVLRFVAVDDAGFIISPTIAEGQVHGGIATGIAQALFEELVYDESGNPLSASFVGYCFPTAAELPSFELHEMQTPTPLNPLGAKGIGEAGTIGATPAVHNAVVDALAPFGVRHVDMPANGERVWRALQAAG
ncbi:MAG TPA: xanthine dehydrogenase family protein molybdopterin-binding subunit [Solirubrobacteraceae bacterium]